MRALVLVVLILALNSCRRRVVVHKHGPHGRVTVIKVRRGPPVRPRVVIVKTRRPGHSHVWVKGHHVYRAGRYTWVKAHWTVPPHKMHVWVPGHHHNGQWSPGHWE